MLEIEVVEEHGLCFRWGWIIQHPSTPPFEKIRWISFCISPLQGGIGKIPIIFVLYNTEEEFTKFRSQIVAQFTDEYVRKRKFPPNTISIIPYVKCDRMI